MNEAISLTVVCIFVVFSALLILMFTYKILGYFFERSQKKEAQKAAEPVVQKPVVSANVEDDNVVAAIALALQMFEAENMHDTESYVLTMNPSSSDWQNRARNFRKYPKQK